VPHVGLRHADAIDRFGQRGGQAAKALLHHAIADTQLFAEEAIEDVEHRAHGHDDAEQGPVVIEHQQAGRQHLSNSDEADEQDVLHANPQCFAVACHPADDPANLGFVIIAHWHPQEMLEDLLPQVMNDGFAHLEGKSLAEVKYDLRGAGEGQDTERTRQNRVQRRVMRDGPVDDGADAPGDEWQLN
jgi:hypothetical protein